MNEKDLFTRFWMEEAKTTAKVLSRIPDNSDYKPDPKSRTAQQIAWQIVLEEKHIIEALESGKMSWVPEEMPASMKTIADRYEKQSADIVARWKRLPAAKWDGDLEFFGRSRPASPMAWSFFHDIIHHRGQITTYLRPMGSTVPQIYGPSHDEP
jgi:uncharacterized damage-inducible protein DinB